PSCTFARAPDAGHPSASSGHRTRAARASGLARPFRRLVRERNPPRCPVARPVKEGRADQGEPKFMNRSNFDKTAGTFAALAALSALGVTGYRHASAETKATPQEAAVKVQTVQVNEG